jgi:outer membrane beta-barrel protein
MRLLEILYMRPSSTLTPALLLLVGLLTPTPAEAGAKAARQALKELREGRQDYDKVQNRFFLKEGRFEIAPILGYVPNNPMVKRYTGGVLGAYHFSETMAVEGAFIYSPDLGTNDLKGLTNTLVQIAQSSSGQGSVFQQPIDKMVLGATFAARWAPVYGKINLIGERVLNFDFYGVAGLGLLSVQKYYAVYDDAPGDGQTPVTLVEASSKALVPINLGIGFDFFLSQSVALKIDARSYLYIDSKPQYDPNEQVTESRPYNNFVASGGVSVFFPKMKPRLMDF